MLEFEVVHSGKKDKDKEFFFPETQQPLCIAFDCNINNTKRLKKRPEKTRKFENKRQKVKIKDRKTNEKSAKIKRKRTEAVKSRKSNIPKYVFGS